MFLIWSFFQFLNLLSVCLLIQYCHFFPFSVDIHSECLLICMVLRKRVTKHCYVFIKCAFIKCTNC